MCATCIARAIAKKYEDAWGPLTPRDGALAGREEVVVDPRFVDTALDEQFTFGALRIQRDARIDDASDFQFAFTREYVDQPSLSIATQSAAASIIDEQPAGTLMARYNGKPDYLFDF